MGLLWLGKLHSPCSAAPKGRAAFPGLPHVPQPPSATASPAAGRGGQGGIPAALCAPSREPWGPAVVCGWPFSMLEDAGEGQGARGVPLSHRVPWHGLVTAALLETCPSSHSQRLVAPMSASPGNLVSSHLGECSGTTAGASGQPSDFGHTGTSLPWLGVHWDSQETELHLAAQALLQCQPVGWWEPGLGCLCESPVRRAKSVSCQETCSKPWENLAPGTGVENINSLYESLACAAAGKSATGGDTISVGNS